MPTALTSRAGRSRSAPAAFRTSVALCLAAVLTVAFFVGSGLLFLQATRDRQATVVRAEAAAVAAADAFDREVAATTYLLRGLASSPVLRSGDLRAFYDQLKATPVPGGARIGLWDQRGQVLDTSQPFGSPLPRVTDVNDYEASFRRLAGSGTSVSDRVLSPISGTYVVSVRLRLDAPGGRMTGFLSASIDEARFAALAAEQRLPPGWTTAFIDRHGRHTARLGVDQRIFEHGLPPSLVVAMGAPAGQGNLVTSAILGAPTLTAFAHSETTDFTALAQVPMSTVDEPVYEALRTIGFGAIVLLVAGGAAVLGFTRQIGKPIEALAAHAARTRDRLDFAEARHASFWKHAPEALFTIEVRNDGRFVFQDVNPAHQRLTGLAAADLIGREPKQCLRADVAESVTARYRECVQQGRPITYEERFDLPVGPRCWRTSLTPVPDPATGRVGLIFGSARDVTRDVETTAELTRVGHTLQSVVSSVSDCYCTFDHNLKLSSANSAALAWMQVDEQEAIGRPMIALPAGDFAEAVIDAIQAREVVRVEVESVLKPGRWLECTAYPSPEGGTSVFFRDVTDRIEVREAAERAQGLLRASIDALSAPVALADREGRILTSNSAWNRHFKAVGGHDLGCLDALRSALPEGGAVAACRGIADMLAGKRDGFRGVYRRDERWFQLSASRFRFGGDAFAVVALEDVTEARLARQEVTELSHQLVGLQEEERQRIASELHDSTFQHLVGMSLNLMRLADGQDSAGREILAEVSGSLDQAMREIRIFSYLLYPTSLSTDGLVATLERFVQGFQRRTGLDVRLTAAEPIDDLPLELQTCALRVVQEALMNAYKHAGARRLSVNARLFGESLVLRVRDDGHGIPGAIADGDVQGAGIRLGVGIPAMRARIRHFGGALVIRGRPSGTTVLAVVAVPKTRASAPPTVLADYRTKAAG